ncbi:MAG TPA: NAD(P)-dependent oxidoreductase [Gammaproteobacteria bacterium]|nr:NAD(P)-dependent oxidoreductase [Gammaproteobacteria bacterium]
MKVAVIGASGLVGGRLYDRLKNMEGVSAKALVHSSGHVWNLARTLEPLTFVDLLDPDTLKQALDGCSHVVNCSRGNPQVMLEGLDNIIACSREAGIRRLIHLSSSTVYGRDHDVAELTEDAPARPAPGYGRLKWDQDEKVIEAGRKGMETIILCPPNITGHASKFMEEMWSALCTGQLGFVDGGRRPFSAVDVDNLCEAIVRSLQVKMVRRSRYFINDGVAPSWAELVNKLEHLSGRTFDTVPVDEEWLRLVTKKVQPRTSVFKSLKHMVSSDVREALRGDPLLARADKGVRGLVAKLPAGVENQLRRSIEGTIRVSKADLHPPVDIGLTSRQLVQFSYSIENARRDLGYEPVLNWAESAQSFMQWRQEYDERLAGYEDLFEDLAPGSAFA